MLKFLRMKRSLSGIKPTGKLTLGNYIGALKNFPKFQDEYENFIFVADLHALTLPIDPEYLKNNTRDLVALYLACGLDPNKTTIFLQSDVSEHSELNSILQNYLYMGELSRMTQFKDKSKKLNQSAIGLGLFAYPALMCADILLYNADVVPVGEDQKQHVELCRDLVHRFNTRYNKEIFVMPEPIVPSVGARIMSLSDPTKKMSKSDEKGDIFLLEDLKSIEKKIMRATTDLGSDIYFDKENKPGISNLLTIYASLKDININEAANLFKDCHRYGDFKKEVAAIVLEKIGQIQEKYNEIIDSNLVDEVLKEGAKKAKMVASLTLKKVLQTVGIYGKK